MSDFLVQDIPNTQLARIAHVAAILLRDGNSESSRALVSQLQQGIDFDQMISPSDGRSNTSFGGIERDVYLRHSAYVHRDDRAALEDRLQRFMVQTVIPDFGLPVDHLGHEIFMIAAMLSKDRFDDARLFSNEFVSSWIAPVASVVYRESTGADRMALELCLTLLEALMDGVPGSDKKNLRGDQVEALEVSWQDLSRRLPHPDIAGMFVTRDQLATIAHALSIPVGFGSRERMVELLIDSAVRYDATHELKRILLEVFEREADSLRLVGRTLAGFDVSSGWLANLEKTAHLVAAVD